MAAAVSVLRAGMDGFEDFIGFLQMSGDGNDQNLTVPVTVRRHRIFRCATLTAGPDGIRKIDAQSDYRAWCSDNASGLADLGMQPVSPSNGFYPRKLVPAYPIWLCRCRFVDTLVPEPCPGDARGLVGHGDEDDIGRPPCYEPVAPAGTGLRFCTAPAQHRSRAMHQQASYVPDSPDGLPV